MTRFPNINTYAHTELEWEFINSKEVQEEKFPKEKQVRH